MNRFFVIGAAAVAAAAIPGAAVAVPAATTSADAAASLGAATLRGPAAHGASALRGATALHIATPSRGVPAALGARGAAVAPGVVNAAGAAKAPASGKAGGAVKVPLVNDCGNGGINGACSSLDMIGTLAGVVKFRHKGNGDLRLMIQVRSAAPSSSYTLQIYCGRTAAAPAEMIGELPDALKTDSAGAATAGPFEVPAPDIKQSCGNGGAIGHIELVSAATGSILDAAPIGMSPDQG